MHGFSKWFARTLAVVGVITVFVSTPEAKQARMDDETPKVAKNLAKDREAAFLYGEAMSAETFQTEWTAFANRLAELYGGREVKMKTVGRDIKSREAFTHLVFMGLRVQARGTSLSPSVQELVSQHSFLQELVLEGSCYTGGNPYPGKMVTLLKSQPELLYLLREQLGGWEDRYRGKFEKMFPPETLGMQK